MRYRWFAKDEDDTDEMGITRRRAIKDMEEPREKNGEEKLF